MTGSAAHFGGEQHTDADKAWRIDHGGNPHQSKQDTRVGRLQTVLGRSKPTEQHDHGAHRVPRSEHTDSQLDPNQEKHNGRDHQHALRDQEGRAISRDQRSRADHRDGEQQRQTSPRGERRDPFHTCSYHLSLNPPIGAVVGRFPGDRSGERVSVTGVSGFRRRVGGVGGYAGVSDAASWAGVSVAGAVGSAGGG